MIYFLIAAICFVFGLLAWVRLEVWWKTLSFFILTSCFILLAGLRGNIEADYSSYLDIYNSSKSETFSTVGIEPLYFFINKVLSSLGLPFQVIVFLMAVCSIPSKCYFFYKYSPNFPFSFLVYFSSVFILFDFIQIRQGLAIAIFIYSIQFIISKDIKRYCFWLIFASSIHISAFLLIPCYFLLNRRYSVWILVTCLSVCSLVNLLKFNIPLVNSLVSVLPIPEMSAAKVAHYSSSTEFSGSSIKQLFLGFLFIFSVRREKSELFYLLMKMYVLGILFTTLFNEMPELAFRIKWYFLWTEAILVVLTVEKFSFNSLFLKILIYTVVSSVYMYGMYSLLDEISTRGNYIFPYRTFMFN